jgi:hypothetical protein
MVGRAAGRVLLVYTILVVPSPAFVLGVYFGDVSDFCGFDSDKGAPSREVPYPER